MKGLNIKTSDDKTFKVDWDVAQQSQTIRKMLDDLTIEEDDKHEYTIPIFHEEVTGLFLKKRWFGWKRIKVSLTFKKTMMTMNQSNQNLSPGTN